MKTNNSSLKIPAAVLSASVIILFILTACTKSMNDVTGPVITPPTNEVFIQGTAFTPATLTVSAGTTVTWTNKDGLIHNVTSDTGVFNSGSIADNGTFSFKFAATGTYPYHCTVHPSMTATVVVN